MWGIFHLSRTQKIGRQRESEALAYFKRRGWRLLERNFLCKAGEIDLILEDPEKTVVFVEVKFRSGTGFGEPQEFVDFRKQARMGRAALFYIKQRRLQGKDFRFDVAAVGPEGVSHIPNAFCPEIYTL